MKNDNNFCFFIYDYCIYFLVCYDDNSLKPTPRSYQNYVLYDTQY